MTTEIITSCDGCPAADLCVSHNLDVVSSTSTSVARSTFRAPIGKVIQPSASSPRMMIIRSGWAAKFILLADGRRQIIDILLPGELATCEEGAFAGTSIPIFAFSNLEVCTFDRDEFMASVEKKPDGLLQLWRSCAVQVQRLRRLLVSMGRQSAEARIADVILSLHERLKAIGMASDDEMPFPLRQVDLAEVLGMTQVHVSRMLALLKSEGIIRIEGNILKLADLPKLERLAQG